MFHKSATLSLSSFLFVLLVLPPGLQAGTLFSPAQTYSGGAFGATSVAIADLNGDGKPDLILTHDGFGTNNQGVVTVLLGNGDGTFNPPVRLDSGAGFATSVAVADVNGDGKLDLIVANCGNTAKTGTCPNQVSDGVVAVFLGNGNGTFQAPATYDSGGGQAVSVAVEDVNLDGKPDVIVGNGCADMACTAVGGVGVLLGNGDGTFRPAIVHNGVSQTSVAVADVNRDGKPDLVLGGPGTNVSVLLGNGDGTFRPLAFYKVAGLSGATAVVADVNGDGNPDLVAVASGNQTSNVGFVSVLLGNGDGTFKPAVSYLSAGELSVSVAVADVDADGKPDILVASCAPKGSACGTTADGTLSVLLGKGDGTFKAAVTYLSGGAFANSVAVADVNGDSRPDLIATNFLNDTAGVLLNNGLYRTSNILTSSLNPSIFGQPVTLTATVTSLGPVQPTGTVVFKNGTSNIGTATLIGGIATLTRSKLPAGTLTLTARYLGDTQSAKSASAPVTQVVKQATTTTTIKSSVNPSTQGQAVTFTAKVTSPTVIPTGSVTFTAGTTILGTITLSGGKASLTTSALPLGTTNITASYSGTADIIGSHASLMQVVN
jgi:Big-like domain-containing protein/VCBS repeat protein